SRLLHDTISSMNIKNRSLETYSETHWVSIYDTTNSIIYVKSAIDKILEEKPNIFTNQEVFQIVCDEDDTFYISCKRIFLIFEPIKQVINLLENCTANLANCFIRIVQIAQFDISPYLLTYYFYSNYQNKGLKNEKFLKIGEIAINYYKKAHYNNKEYSIEDENSDLQKLAKTMFAIIPLQTNSVLQDLVDLLDPIFGADNNQVESILTKEETEETSIEFESRSLF
ncbi:44275_t:CDS:2, partial [Gigaspora margarita]